MAKSKDSSCELAIDIAVQTTKLFIGLATSILAFTITFPDKINNGVINWVVKVPWCFLVISIIAGVILLQTIIGELDDKGKVSLYQTTIRRVAIIQNLLFLAAVVWVAIAIIFCR